MCFMICSVYGKGDKAAGSKSGSFYSEMDPTLLPTIIKKGSSMMEEEPKNKPSTWGQVFKQPSVIVTIIGVLCGIALMFVPLDPDNSSIQKTLGILIIMATCWVTEILPLSVTALFPVVLCPLLGVSSAKSIASQYFNDTIFMFMSGFLISLAMEKWNLHFRIALAITSCFERPRSILFGVMFAAWFLSMWISNTAAALMMVANITALVETLENHYGKKKLASFSKAVMIGIAFSCNVGGFATLIGTPPNMTFSEVFKSRFPHNATDPNSAPEITFSSWMLAVAPSNFLLFLLLWLYFAIFYCPSEKELKIEPGYCKGEYKKLGKASYEEKVVFTAFVIVALLWLFRADLGVIPGWSNIFGPTIKSYLSDATVGMLVVLCLFFIPTKKSLKRTLGENDDATILTWDTAKQMPWDLVLLFGGGFALASACTDSGLSVWIGEKLKGMGGWPRFLAILSITIVVCILTSFTSNTATANILLPVMVGIAQQTRINPLLLMVPVAIACSCAFLLPVGTPPNLVVFASKRLTMLDMVKAGIVTTILAVIIIMIITFVMLPLVYDVKINEYPVWAELCVCLK